MSFSEDVDERCQSELRLAKDILSSEIKSLRTVYMEMSEQLVPFEPSPEDRDFSER